MQKCIEVNDTFCTSTFRIYSVSNVMTYIDWIVYGLLMSHKDSHTQKTVDDVL